MICLLIPCDYLFLQNMDKIIDVDTKANTITVQVYMFESSYCCMY